MAQKKKIAITVIIVFIGLVIAIITPAVFKARVGGRMVQHSYIYRLAKAFYEDQGYYPNSLDVFHLKFEKIHYYPQNWSDPNAIILESQIHHRKIITFSNGKMMLYHKGQLEREYTFRKD